MKYRRLNQQELITLKQEFVKFLAANHVTADDWEKLKKQKSEKVEGLIGIFSDIVIDDTIKKIQYLEFTTPKDYKIFFCDKAIIYLMGISIKDVESVNFLEMNLIEALPSLIQTHEGNIELYSAQKEYQKGRDLELFQMIEKGCLISKEGSMFHLLKKIKTIQ